MTQQQIYDIGRHVNYSDYVRAELRRFGRVHGKRTLRAALRKVDAWRHAELGPGGARRTRPPKGLNPIVWQRSLRIVFID